MLRALRSRNRREPARSRLAFELTWALLLKTAALLLLWWLFFSSDTDVPQDGATIGRHVFDLPMNSPPPSEETEHGSGNRR